MKFGLDTMIFTGSFTDEYTDRFKKIKELGFDGVVVSDDILMRAISKHYPEEKAIARAVEAGVDMVLHSNVDKYDEAIADRIVAVLRRLVESGRISEARIEQSFQRVMSLKRRYGLI